MTAPGGDDSEFEVALRVPEETTIVKPIANSVNSSFSGLAFRNKRLRPMKVFRGFRLSYSRIQLWLKAAKPDDGRGDVRGGDE